jgi:hypothetical protein
MLPTHVRKDESFTFLFLHPVFWHTTVGAFRRETRYVLVYVREAFIRDDISLPSVLQCNNVQFRHSWCKFRIGNGQKNKSAFPHTFSSECLVKMLEVSDV